MGIIDRFQIKTAIFIENKKIYICIFLSLIERIGRHLTIKRVYMTEMMSLKILTDGIKLQILKNSSYRPGNCERKLTDNLSQHATGSSLYAVSDR